MLKVLGDHPDGGPVQVLDGKYGPYVSYQKINVTLPKEMKPEEVTLPQALAWLTEKAGTKPSGKTAARKKVSSAKSPTVAAKTKSPATKKALQSSTKKTAAKTTKKQKA